MTHDMFNNIFSSTRKLLLAIFLLATIISIRTLLLGVDVWNKQKSSSSHYTQFLPSCHPTFPAQPISRIYFYHIRKAGGTMIRNYLRKVASHYNISLEVLEYSHASRFEEVGSRNDTIYITNLRDPVERSISHYKYSERWDCDQLVKNSTFFVPTRYNARPFNTWNSTHGFVESEWDKPFSFTACAVNCYIQTFSGRGFSSTYWMNEYNTALERLRKYHLILVFEKFKDPNYVKAIERYFGGVSGFNEHTSMYCGMESKRANDKWPLSTNEFAHVFKLIKLNKMDDRLYSDYILNCWDDNDGQRDIKYNFPKADRSRFVPQENRTVIG